MEHTPIAYRGDPACETCSGWGFAITDRGAVKCSCLPRVMAPLYLRRARIPEHLRDRTVAEYRTHTPHQTAARNAAVAFVKDWTPTRRGLYLWGGVGTGKSHLAVAVLRAVVSQHATPGLYVSWPHLMAAARVACGQQIEDSPLDGLADWPLLVVDEIGQRDGAFGSTEFERESLYRLADARQGRPTVWTTNLGPTDLARVYDDRIASRILGGADIFEVTGPDGRKAAYK